MTILAFPQPESDRFDDWWQAYPHPRRVKKALCRELWNRITGEGLETRTLDKDSNTYFPIFLKATPEEIIAATKRYAERNRKPGIGNFGYVEDGKFICMSSSFLNQGRFLDD